MGEPFQTRSNSICRGHRAGGKLAQGTRAEPKGQGGWSTESKGRVLGEVREGQMRQGFVGHIKEFSFHSKSSGKPLKDLSRVKLDWICILRQAPFYEVSRIMDSTTSSESHITLYVSLL